MTFFRTLLLTALAAVPVSGLMLMGALGVAFVTRRRRWH